MKKHIYLVKDLVGGLIGAFPTQTWAEQVQHFVKTPITVHPVRYYEGGIQEFNGLDEDSKILRALEKLTQEEAALLYKHYRKEKLDSSDYV